MGKDFRKDVGRAARDLSSKPLTTQPFKKELREFKPWGPACLVCGDTIDTRIGASVVKGQNGTELSRGARRPQRQGYVHDRCNEPVDGKLPKHVHSNLLSSLNEGAVEILRGKFMDMVQGRGIAMEFPTYSEAEMEAAVEAGEALPS